MKRFDPVYIMFGVMAVCIVLAFACVTVGLIKSDDDHKVIYSEKVDVIDNLVADLDEYGGAINYDNVKPENDVYLDSYGIVTAKIAWPTSQYKFYDYDEVWKIIIYYPDGIKTWVFN